MDKEHKILTQNRQTNMIVEKNVMKYDKKEKSK